MNRREFLKKSLEGIIVGIPLISGCGKNPLKSDIYPKTIYGENLELSILKAEWYTTTHYVPTEWRDIIEGTVRLNINGYTDGDRVTYLDYGDGLISEMELKLSETKEFDEDVRVRFTHNADYIPRKYTTIITAYKENDKISIEMGSEELQYLHLFNLGKSNNQ